ncbi:MAG: methyltransferase domain-containing protein [Pseudomonadota bacterium]
MAEKSQAFMDVFEDVEHAAAYADGPAKFMPGYHDVQRMAGVLIRESAPKNARVLVHGAGGGAELEVFARENPLWTLLGVEPAKPMLDAARERLGDLNARVQFHHGYIEDAPPGPFDAATSLLTLHFLNAVKRQNALSELVRRLVPGSPVVVAHCSFPQGVKHRDTWLARHQAFTTASGVDPDVAENGRNFIADRLEVLDPETDETIMGEAGLRDVTQFYSAFTWRGWIGHVS